MEYRAVGNRCAVNFKSLYLPISDAEALAILEGKGFQPVYFNLVELARLCISSSVYRRGACITEAPAVVDCSSFIKWLYGQKGIWLPRWAIQQFQHGDAVSLDELAAGDVVFTAGRINRYWTNSGDGIGHVGLATGEGTVVHAAGKTSGVMEIAIGDFIGPNRFRGARRYIPAAAVITTWLAPSTCLIETEDDFRWIVLESLPKSTVCPPN